LAENGRLFEVFKKINIKNIGTQQYESLGGDAGFKLGLRKKFRDACFAEIRRRLIGAEPLDLDFEI